VIRLTRMARRIRALLRRDAWDAELDEEMRHHLAMEADDIARLSGVPADEARRRALVGLGASRAFRKSTVTRVASNGWSSRSGTSATPAAGCCEVQDSRCQPCSCWHSASARRRRCTAR
jgi:sirohydrochlorin ferrochelatase